MFELCCTQTMTSFPTCHACAHRTTTQIWDLPLQWPLPLEPKNFILTAYTSYYWLERFSKYISPVQRGPIMMQNDNLTA